jgi:hypothetical protein
VSNLTLESPSLRVVVNPRVGGTITAVCHRPTGLSVLGTVPWESVNAPLPNLAARDEPEWLTRYTGGWPLLFPNGGDACTVDGTFHGFHGEASVAPWETEMADDSLVLTRRFMSLPASMRRTISLDDETVAIREELIYSGSKPMDVMWGHHPTFGSDLLATPFEVTCGARHVVAETQFDPPASPIAPGAAGAWPTLTAKAGKIVDLGHPNSPWASVAYLSDFNAPWAAIRRLDDAIAVLLTWDGAQFPCAWLWYELAATQDAPWNGRTHLVGIEPSTTPCALGLSEAVARGASLLRLEPGASVSAAISLRVFKPTGPILNGLRDLPTRTPDERVKPS